MKPNASSTVRGAKIYIDLAVERNKNVSDVIAALPGLQYRRTLDT